MKLIKPAREKMVSIAIRVDGIHADRHRRTKEIAVRHNATIDLRGAVERLIDAAWAEAQALEATALTAAAGTPCAVVDAADGNATRPPADDDEGTADAGLAQRRDIANASVAERQRER